MIIITKLHTIFKDACMKKAKSIVRKKIRNKDFTLITSTCIGGVIYNRLGLRFNSPTINTWISQKDFCKFCSSLEYYISQDLVFYDEPTRDCPVAKLDDVTVVFVHYNTEEEARNKWEERKKRINWDNLYIITSDGNGVTDDELNSLDNVSCKRKLIITARNRPEIKNSFYVKGLKKEESGATHQIVSDKITGLRKWELEFDYVSWLNGETCDGRKYNE